MHQQNSRLDTPIASHAAPCAFEDSAATTPVTIAVPEAITLVAAVNVVGIHDAMQDKHETVAGDRLMIFHQETRRFHELSRRPTALDATGSHPKVDMEHPVPRMGDKSRRQHCLCTSMRAREIQRDGPYVKYDG